MSYFLRKKCTKLKSFLIGFSNHISTFLLFYMVSFPHDNLIFRPKNTAAGGACYVSKVWRFVFIWAGLTKYNKGRFKVMATYLQQ